MVVNCWALWESIGQGADHYHVSVYGFCGNEPLLFQPFGAVKIYWRRALLISSDLTEGVLQDSHRLCYLQGFLDLFPASTCTFCHWPQSQLKVTFPFVWEISMGRDCSAYKPSQELPAAALATPHFQQSLAESWTGQGEPGSWIWIHSGAGTPSSCVVIIWQWSWH